MRSAPPGAWPPTRHRVRAVTDAILAELARSAAPPISRQTANTLAIAALTADRRVALAVCYGRAARASEGAEPA
jgi:hypothetical protein